MFYHDHAWGTTRQDVYIGEAAGYIVRDQTEQNLIDCRADSIRGSGDPPGPHGQDLCGRNRDPGHQPQPHPQYGSHLDMGQLARNDRALGCDQCGPRDRRPLVAPCIHAGSESLCTRLERDRCLWPVALRSLVLAAHQRVFSLGRCRMYTMIRTVYQMPAITISVSRRRRRERPILHGVRRPSWIPR